MSAPILRELIYLDRVRVESYISQLSGGLAIQETTAEAASETLTGKAAAHLGPLSLGATGQKTDGATQTITRAPAHAVLRTLELLLEEHDLVVDAAKSTVLPGQIARLRADATFESWGMLASLADSVQGVATLGAKIYSATKGEASVASMRSQLTQLEKLVKMYKRRSAAQKPEIGTATVELGKAIGTAHTILSVIDGRYIDDVKEVVKLFFQDQNHIRLSARGKTYVGLLRRSHLVGSSMEEMLFDYGAKPKAAFDALFYVAEFGREESLDIDVFTERMNALRADGISVSVVQKVIRRIGTFLLELAEELRRPTGDEQPHEDRGTRAQS